METGRLEAFTDGVIAVIITIMVLELKAPHTESWIGILDLWPVLLSYLLSFINVGIYWANHHHLMQLVKSVNGRVIWANLHLLFWVSLFPFTTSWLAESHFAAIPTALYGIVLLMASVAWPILAHELIASDGSGSQLAKAIGSDFKGKISIIAYLAAIALSFVSPWISCALFAAVALMWFLPDRRIEKRVLKKAEAK